jgi:hypothetical protein
LIQQLPTYFFVLQQEHRCLEAAVIADFYLTLMPDKVVWILERVGVVVDPEMLEAVPKFFAQVRDRSGGAPIHYIQESEQGELYGDHQIAQFTGKDIFIPIIEQAF